MDLYSFSWTFYLVDLNRDFTGEVVTDVHRVINSPAVVIRATMTGGKGENAWQHSQLFRQEMKSNEYPLELCLTFH